MSTSSLKRFLLFTSPLSEPVIRQLVRVRVLRWDPRTRDRTKTLMGLLKHGRTCTEEARHGMMPFDQPVRVVTRYPRPAAAPPARPGLRHRLRQRLSPGAA